MYLHMQIYITCRSAEEAQFHVENISQEVRAVVLARGSQFCVAPIYIEFLSWRIDSSAKR